MFSATNSNYLNQIDFKTNCKIEEYFENFDFKAGKYLDY